MMRHALYAVAGMALILVLAACDPLPAGELHTDGKTTHPATVTILHTNDFHSQFDPLSPPDEPSQGGAARNKTLIDRIRAEKGEQNVLLVNAGDNFQGTMFFNTWKGSAEVMHLNHLRFDAITLGNHEFDLGSESLARALAGEPLEVAGVVRETEPAKFITVASNVNATDLPRLNELLVKRAIIHKGGNSYGIIGVTTETTANVSSPGDKVHFEDYLASVEAQVQALEAEGINKIILLSHSGSDEDMKRVPSMRGIDVIVAGHDHALFGDPEAIRAMGLPEQAKQVKAPYPAVMQDKDGNNVLIVSAMEKGRWLGNIDVTFDENGLIQQGAWDANPVFVHGCIYEKDANGTAMLPDCSKQVAEPDVQYSKVIDIYREPLDAIANEVVGEAGVNFKGRHAADAEGVHSMGNLVADITLARTKDAQQADAAILNRGGMRADLPKGTVRYSDISTVLPFDSTITVVELSGAELLEAMDIAVSEAGGQSYGAFPHVSGMEIEYCAEGNCEGALMTAGYVTELEVQGEDIRMDGRYRIATNSYLTDGGDFYALFEIACKREGNYCVDTGIIQRDAVADWFRQHSPVGPVSQDRVTQDD